MIHLGFTGTRHGMTPPQYARMRDLVIGIARRHGVIDGINFHHGDCVGADAQFHAIVRQEIGGWIVGHLPLDQSRRAHCDFDETRAPLEFMRRNRAIVSESPIMFAAPHGMTEESRGGTWGTINMARKAGRELVIAYPDGSVSEENVR